MTEELLGFDIRISTLQGSSALTRGVRTGAKVYYGVDSTCWSTPEEFKEIQKSSPKDSWRGPNLGLWESLDQLESYAAHLVLPLESAFSIIAITIVPELGLFEILDLPRVGLNYIYLKASTPCLLDPAWRKLGYDVADCFLDSPLCTFGALLDSEEDLKPILNNPSGLYPDPASANQARLKMNELVPAHAPFLVYGVYLIEERQT